MKDHRQTSHIDQFLEQVKERSDRLMNFFLWSYFALGFVFACFYDTWLIALSIGGLSMAAYYSAKFVLPKSNLYQYVLSVVMGIFMAQYIYQMHGMFEMHFFAFVGSTILITYQNWKLQIPLALVVIIHHGVFGWLQYKIGREVYFTQLDYMPFQTLVIHGALATFIFGICGLWAHTFQVSSHKQIHQSFEIGKLQEADVQKQALINERKRSEDELEKSHSLVEATLESTADGILVTDHKGNIVLFNKKFAKLWGIAEADLAHMDESELLNASLPLLVDSQDYISHIHELYAQSGAVCLDVLRLNNGLVLERYSQPQVIGGQSVGRVWNFRDITERKLAVEMLEHQNRELVKANAELDRFVYSASHELRAPLTSVMGLISIAQMSEQDPSQRKILEMMQLSVDRLDRFIIDIVNYSGNSRLDLEVEEIHFESLVSECIAEFRYMPESEKTHIVTEITGDLPFYSDQKRIAVVIKNLLSNALKYQNMELEKPFIRIAISVTQTSADITVIDNGFGIEPEHQEKIYNMFYRATQRKSGTGLGLYIVKEILAFLGGTVRVESEIGKGTTFYVSIPQANPSVA